ncbi:MAG: glycosyltransferase family 2 protein [Bacteroidota bacterium]|nr:glycosyltransferase family 2 protein [Bacteroidota bacterium]
MKIAAIVPAYNESHAIKDVVQELIATGINSGIDITVVVINDCSTDNTGEIIDQLPCVAIHLPVNLGIGGAVQTGFKFAFENDFDFAIQVDGDGQHPAGEISKIISGAIENNWDITIGSRFLTNEGFQSSSMRRAGIKYFSKLNKLLTGFLIYDTTSGFRLLNKKALAIVSEYYPDEYPEPEALVLYARHKLRVGEVQVQMRERQGGISSINSTGAIYYMGKVTLACLFTRVRRGK